MRLGRIALGVFLVGVLLASISVPIEADVQCSIVHGTSIVAGNSTTSASFISDAAPCSLNGGTTALTSLISAYWSLDDQFFGATANYESKVADASLDLTPTNNPLRAPSANRLPAAQFVDGNSEYLSVTDPWTSGDIDFSVGCWVYLDDLTGDLPIASKDDGTQQEWRLYFDDNTTDAWVFEIFDGAGASRGSVSSAEVPAATTWTFVVGGHDATNNEVNVSVNGAAYTTAATSGVAVDTDDPFELGRMTAATYHDGRLSQCFFIKEELSAADLGDLYNGGVPVPSRQFAARVATAAEGLWDLSELSGNRSDFTSNAVTLTDTNTVLHGAGLAPRAYKAASFTASASESLSRADEAQLRLGDNDWTVVAWARPNSLPSSAGVMSKYNSASAAAEFYLRQTATVSSQIVLYGTDHSTIIGNRSITSPAPVIGEWGMLTGYHKASDNTYGVAFNDGTYTSASTTGAFSAGVASVPFRIGALAAASNYYDGTIGPAAIFSEALTQAQKDKLYAGGQAFSCDTIPADLPTPTLCWDLDEPSGTRSASIGSADLTDNNTVLSSEGIADIPGGVTLRAADFTQASSEYLSRTSETQLQLGAADWTIVAWARATDTTSVALLGKDSNGAGSREYGITLNSNSQLDNIAFDSSGAGTCRPSAASVGAVTAEEWFMAAFYNDQTGGDCGAALNDGTWVTDATPGTLIQGATEFRIGGNGQATDKWDGQIGPVAIWNGTALSQAQKDKLYNSGDALNCSDVEAVVGVAPTVCWNLSEVSGTRSATIGTADLTDNNTVLSTGGLVRGRTGHASDLDGVDQYHNLDDEAVLSSSDTDFCVVASFIRDTSTSNDVIFSRSESASVREWSLSFASGGTTLTWEVFDTDGTSIGSETAALANSEWHHVIGCHSATSNQIQLAVDGGAFSTSASTGAPADKAADTRVGAISTTEADFFDGSVDEIFYLTSIPSATQVACLYNSGLGKSYADLVAGDCDE